MDVVRYLLKRGADITVQNDVDETAFDVCSGRMQKMILGKYVCVYIYLYIWGKNISLFCFVFWTMTEVPAHI